ncbi:hypothetical protein QP157_07610 [Sphingomonas sp. LR61]|uniref:hypothetical protein n=1 Tax=Sphingomonas sp. LR61 TaxID=3050234 RepID=UPI002FE03DDB
MHFFQKFVWLAVFVGGATLVATPAVAVEGPDILQIEQTGGRIYPYAGLGGTTSVRVTSPAKAASNDVFVHYTPLNDDSGMTPDGESTCAQPGGPGSTVDCGPYKLEANKSVLLNFRYMLPADYLLRHGQKPFDMHLTASSAALDYTSKATIATTKGVMSAVSIQTGLRIEEPGSPAPSRPSVSPAGDYDIFSPGRKDLQLITAYGGYSDIRNIQIKLLLPEHVHTLTLPETCERIGSIITCTRPLTKAATFSVISLPIEVDNSLSPGTHIPLSLPTASVSSPNEPKGEVNSWDGIAKGGPYALVVNPSVDVWLGSDSSVSTVEGRDVQFELQVGNADNFTAADEVSAMFSLSGATASNTRVDLEGCTVVDSAHIACDIGPLGPGESLRGTVTTFVPTGTAGNRLVLEGQSKSGAVERDGTNNASSR